MSTTTGDSEHDSLWIRFEAMLQVHASAVLGALNPAATPAQIENAEAAMQVQLPDEVRAAYLRHNGSSGGGKLFSPLCRMASLEEMVQIWRSHCTVANDLRQGRDREFAFPPYEPYWDTLKVRPGWFDERWIPVGASDTPSSMFVDLNPGPAGVHGQLLDDDGMGEAKCIANGFNAFLELLIQKVEQGKLIYREGWVSTTTDEKVYDWTLLD